MAKWTNGSIRRLTAGGLSGRLSDWAAEPHSSNIAAFRTAADAVFAVEDRCPHKGGPLSQGIVSGHSVTCPLHGWNVGLETGEACAPDQGCTRKRPVRVEDGEVMLGLAQAGSGSAFRA